MLAQRDNQVELPANALDTAFEAVAAELRLVDVADYIAYIHAAKLANIQDIVNSSVELFFKPGTLSFGWGAEFALDWNSLPVITLDMEFRHRAVRLVFKLILRALQTNVTVEYLSLGKASGDPRQDMAVLIQAIAGARLSFHEH
ncbi:MAG: hypothetical protein ACRD36_07665 [Candidatus Acidiferrum sp.]